MQNEELFRIVNDPMNKKILNILRCKPDIEKTTLAKELKIAFQTVSKQIDILKEQNILCNSNRMEINTRAYLACGISIGGAQCKITLVDAGYRVIDENYLEEIFEKTGVLRQSFLKKGENNRTGAGYRYFETPDNLKELTENINELIKDIIKLHDYSKSISTIPPISSIGIALTGSIDASKQVILKSHNLSYLKNMKREMLVFPDVLQKLREREIPLIIDHNAKALAVCEKYSLYQTDNINKIYQNKRNILSFYLGSGISCGLILNNKLERGCRNLNGELGHIVVPRYPKLQNAPLKDEQCTCGGRGCLEQYIISDGFGMTREEFKASTSEMLQEKLRELSEEEYKERLSILGYYIGWAIDLCIKLLNVGLIIFSGKMTCIMDDLWGYITYPQSNLEEGFLDCTKITSKYGALAPAIGAGILSTCMPNEGIEWPEMEII